jgi:hypothetical protein
MAENMTPKRAAGTGTTFLLVVSWLWVGVPLAWGVLLTIRKSLSLFQ